MTSGTGRHVKNCSAAAVVALAAVAYGDDPINLLDGVPVTVEVPLAERQVVPYGFVSEDKAACTSHDPDRGV